MKFEIDVSDEHLDAMAALIAEKIGIAPKEEDDDLMGDTPKGDAPKELTLTDVQDAIQKGVAAVGKDKVKAVLAKFKVKAGSDLDKADYEKFIDAVSKLKK